LFGIFFTPVFYSVIRWMTSGKKNISDKIDGEEGPGVVRSKLAEVSHP
jgi:hypothetical protein